MYGSYPIFGELGISEEFGWKGERGMGGLVRGVND